MQIPWFGKIAAKIVLARLPVSHARWRRLGLFSHGAMLDPAYALDVFVRHFERARAVRPVPPAFTALEIGPGDSLLGGLASAAHGAARTYLIDSGNFADRSPLACRAMIEYMNQHGLHLRDAECADWEALQARFGIDYRSRGLASLREIPSASVDFVWSQAVLEHVRRRDFAETCRELRRVLKADGVASHRVDLKDHLGGGLNNLRFSERFWESPLMADSGFYTNRIRFREMLDLFEAAGLRVARVVTETWDSLPIRRASLAEPFSAMSDEELGVRGFDVVLVPG